jgi:hypothetical protein
MIMMVMMDDVMTLWVSMGMKMGMHMFMTMM